MICRESRNFKVQELYPKKRKYNEIDNSKNILSFF